MRVLDLGAHDGFVSKGLLHAFPDAHIDAVELHPEFAKVCHDRISGECKVGSAEDAPLLFKPGTYDAVVAFELIEHVPEVDRLLAACEMMLKPEGRAYISTPDTTFGDGNNPHHLRTYRAVDLVDALRRRGEVVDLEQGADGIVTASYKPAPRREDVAIYLGGCWQPWHPVHIEQKGLGGSETAAVRLAEQLWRLGFVVTVYADTVGGEDVIWQNVIVRHYTKFDPLEPRGAVICSRVPELADRPIAAQTRLLWLHDTDCGNRLTPQRAETFDHVLCLSGWHERHVRNMYPFLKRGGRWVTRRVRNGIHHGYFNPLPFEDRKPWVMYTSSPDRGLDVLLELWPQILERAPGAELHHCYADVYDAVAAQNPVVAAHRDKIRGLSDQPGVTHHGSLGQPQLAAMMCKARVWAHPSWASIDQGPFHETSCLGAMEAQAAGCRVVASRWGALAETVQWGALIGSKPGSARWRAALVDAIVEGLTDDDVGRAAVQLAPPAVAWMDWQGVAEQVGVLVAVGDHGTPARHARALTAA